MNFYIKKNAEYFYENGFFWNSQVDLKNEIKYLNEMLG